MQFSRIKIVMSLVGLFAMTPLSAWALTASNTQIVNNAQMTYNDGATARTATATPVVVTVTLVPGAPIIGEGPNQNIPYTAANSPATNTFYVYAANTNGPDSYTLTPAITGTPSNTSSPSVSITAVDGGAFANPVTIGATVTLGGCTVSSLVVPSDGVADSTVNGIKANDWIIVNGDTANPRQVASVTDNAAGTSTITLSSNLGAAPAAGILVSQRRSVTVTVLSGTITTAGQSIVITKHLTATSTSTGNPTTTSGDITDTYTSGAATLNKYVRNVTQNTMTGTTSAAAPAGCGGATYYQSGISAKPGDVLEYMLVANNTGTGAVSAAVMSDALPVSYVTLQANVYSSGTKDVAYCNEANAMAYYSAAGDLDQATFASPNLTINVGATATNAAGGTIASGATVRSFYQVKVNP